MFWPLRSPPPPPFDFPAIFQRVVIDISFSCTLQKNKNCLRNVPVSCAGTNPLYMYLSSNKLYLQCWFTMPMAGETVRKNKHNSPITSSSQGGQEELGSEYSDLLSFVDIVWHVGF